MLLARHYFNGVAYYRASEKSGGVYRLDGQIQQVKRERKDSECDISERNRASNLRLQKWRQSKSDDPPDIVIIIVGDTQLNAVITFKLFK